jgi:hypothetical protein
LRRVLELRTLSLAALAGVLPDYTL